MKVAIVIPSRGKSVRFPGKPLAMLEAPDGARRSLVEWCWRAASPCKSAREVLVATDDQAIADHVAEFGGTAMMTSPDLRNGTERCAAVLDALDEEPDVIVNWQGDNPLLPVAMVDALVASFADPAVEVSTPCVIADEAMALRLQDDIRQGIVGGTCVVTDAAGRALYFSKYPIPHGASRSREGAGLKMHIGLYAYRPEALAEYRRHAPSPAEQAEGLEQLRFLDRNIPVNVIPCALPKGGLWEVNNPQDVPVVEALLPTER